jgi:hypothetical protein
VTGRSRGRVPAACGARAPEVAALSSADTVRNVEVSARLDGGEGRSAPRVRAGWHWVVAGHRGTVESPPSRSWRCVDVGARNDHPAPARRHRCVVRPQHHETGPERPATTLTIPVALIVAGPLAVIVVAGRTGDLTAAVRPAQPGGATGSGMAVGLRFGRSDDHQPGRPYARGASRARALSPTSSRDRPSTPGSSP